MSKPRIKGYCPGALRPMLSGDGIVVRLRPFGGRLRSAQAVGIATLAIAHGNGMIDLSTRGNLQLRGVTEDSYEPLLEKLHNMGLLDETQAIESRRNILVTPFWQAGDETEVFTTQLTNVLVAEGVNISSKFGFALDTGITPVLQSASADIRLERATDGSLILAADGSEFAKPVTPATIITEAMKLADWFAANRGEHKRMAALLASGTMLPEGFTTPRQMQVYLPTPGHTPEGELVGLAFGQLSVEALSSLAKYGDLRMTPWRMLLVEGARKLPQIDGLISDPNDPLLRVTACTGAPRCTQGLAETRSVARTLAPHLKTNQFIHVSGCAKGCAHPHRAALTVTATQRGFDLIKGGRADDKTSAINLTIDDIVKAI